MNCTSEPLRIQSENLKQGILLLLGDLRTVNSKIITQRKANEESVENLKQTHEANIAHLLKDNVELEELFLSNEEFIQGVEQLMPETTVPEN